MIHSSHVLSVLFFSSLVAAGCGSDPSPSPNDASTRADTNAPVDASTPTDTPSGPMVPSPNDWMTLGSSVNLTFEAPGGAAQGSTGTASLGIGPIGTPANTYIFTFSAADYPMTGAGFTDCRVGLIYNPTSNTFTFSDNALVTQRCVASQDGMPDSTLTFTSALVQVGALNNLYVRLQATASGPVGSGPLTVQVNYPAP